MRAVEKFGQRLLLGLVRLLLRPLPPLKDPPVEPERILLVRADRIGDLIVSTGAIRAIHRRYPKAELSLVASALNREVVHANPAIHRLWVYRGWNFIGLLWALRAVRWDLVIDLNTAYSTSSGFLVRFLKTDARVSFEKQYGDMFYNKRFAADHKAHRADEAMKIVRWLGGDDSDPSYEVFPSTSDDRRADEALHALGIGTSGKRVAVHPGNIRKFDNRWPQEKFADLCDRLAARDGVQLLLLQGPGEEPLIEDILVKMNHTAPVVPVLPLLTTAALLRKMDLVICNSTGTMHLAAAARAHTFAFLSGYGDACWRARGDRHHALVGSTWGSCRDISVDKAWVEITRLLESGI